MEFDVLGPLVVRRDGVPVTLGTPKQRALLILLILQVGRVVSLGRLIEGLWGEDPPPHARVTLRSYVSNVRRSLEASGEEPVIVTHGHGYALEVPAEAIDALRFERLVRAGRDRLSAGDPERGLARLDEALGLWRGPALADVADDDFARGEVARLEESRLACEEDRFEALLHARRHAEAVPGLEAFIARHPLRERPHAQLMLALYRSARAPEALEVFRRFREHLVGELGLDPSASLQQLADRMLNQAPDLDLPSRPASAAQRASTPSAPRHLDVGASVVGRVPERRAMETSLERLAQGSGGLLLLAGEPGIGKTALLEELAVLAQDAGMGAVWGRCRQGEGTPAFWPWRQVLRGVAHGLGDDALRRAAAGVGGGVTQISGEIAERLGQRPRPQAGDLEAARFELYEATATFLLRAATDGLVLLLDDLHWADAPSLQLLSFLTAQVPASHLLLAASYRDLPAERSTELDATLATVAREPAVEHFALAGLAPEDVAALAALVAGHPPPDDLLAVLHERTGGNPFFLRQLASLLDGEAQDWAAVVTAVPAGVRHVLTRRVSELPPPTRRILSVAAVSGVQFDARVLAAADDQPLDEVMAALEAALDEGLVAAVGRPATAYRFVHTLVREAIYDDLRTPRAARLHAAVGGALEETGRGSVEELAGHFSRAADLVDDDRPVRYLLAAADEAMQLLAHEPAEAHLRRALEVLDDRREPDHGAEFEILARLCRLEISTRGWTSPTLADTVGRLRGLADPAVGGPGLGALGRAVWSYYFYRGEFDEARAVVSELTVHSELTDDPVGRATARLGQAFFLLYEPGGAGRAVEELAEARASAQRVPERLAEMPEHLGVAIRGMEALARAIGGLPGALDAARDAVALADEVARPFPRVYARLHGSLAGVGVDEPDLVRAWAGEALELCGTFGFPQIAELVAIPHAWAEAMLGGDVATAAARVTDALEMLRAGGDFINTFLGLGLLAEIRLKGGDRAGARSALDQARGMPDAYAGHIDLIAGRLEQALGVTRQA